jgi:hypothetical protein
MRWRVKASRRLKSWFYASEVYFVDAADAHGAKREIEGRSTPEEAFEVWALTPATPEMEAQHADLLARRAEWITRAKSGGDPRGLL